MKIIECYISAFGGLKNKRFTFNEGLNPFIGKNGAGKTTLTVFIKTMLYGIGETKKVSIEKNDRKHYLPHGGGFAGGSLTFIQDGKKYRIERTFGKKAADDTLSVLDLTSGLQTNEFGDKPAEKIFSIDAMGFERTVFLSEKNLSPKSNTESISLKLSQDTDHNLDSEDMERGKRVLDEQRKFYHKKGGGGEISATRAEIFRIDAQIEALGDTEKRLNAVLDKLDALEQQFRESAACREDISRRRSALAVMDAKSSMQARTLRLKEEISRLEERRGEILVFFNGQVPSYEEIEQNLEIKKEAELLLSGASGGENNGEYDGLRSLFLGRCTLLEVEAVRQTLSESESLDKNRQNRILGDGVLPTADLNSEKIENAVFLFRKSKRKGRGLGIFMSIFWGIMALVGASAGCFLMPELYAVGAVCAVISLFFVISLCVLEAKRKKGYRNALEFLSDYYLNKVENSEVQAKLSALLSLSKEIEILDGKLAVCNGHIEAFVDKFFTRGGINAKALASELVSKYDRFIALENAARVNERAEENVRRARMFEQQAEDFLSRYKVCDPDPFMQIKSYEREYRLLTERIISIRGELEGIGASFSINENSTEKESDTEAKIKSDEAELESRIRDISAQSALLEDEKRRLESALSELDSLIAAKNKLEERLQSYENALKVITLTGEFLVLARENMTSKYIGKCRESFGRYTSYLRPDSTLLADINADLETTVTDGAATYSSDGCSRGERELYGLCARLSLIDALYGTEDIPIILDDPFISFDDSAVKKAKMLIEKVAAGKQILYFTCSESRSFDNAVKLK